MDARTTEGQISAETVGWTILGMYNKKNSIYSIEKEITLLSFLWISQIFFSILLEFIFMQSE